MQWGSFACYNTLSSSFLPLSYRGFYTLCRLFLIIWALHLRSSKPPLEHLSHQTPLSDLCELRQPRQHCSGVFSTLMWLGKQLQCIQCVGGSFYLDILYFLPFHVFRGWALMAWMPFRSEFSVSKEKFLLGPVFFISSDMFNMDCLSHVNFSDGLVSSDGSKA